MAQTSITAIIEKLRNISGSNAKKQWLEQNDSRLLRAVLEKTYNPFLKYGLKKVKPVKSLYSDSIEASWSRIYNLLDELAKGHGDAYLKNRVQRVLELMKLADQELVICIINKDLKAGISAKTINAVFPGLIEEFGIMKAATFTDSLWTPNLMGSVKLDGYRCLVRNGILLSSGGHRILGAEHIEEQIKGFGDFDGEIMVPGMEFNEGGGVIRSANVTPDAKLFLFDCINDPDTPFKNRYAELEVLGQENGWSFSLVKPSTITVMRHKRFDFIEDMYETYKKALYAGYEGLVLKDPDGYYELKRSKAWLKVKQVLSETCKIVGFFEGQGQLEGNLGGIIVKRQNGYESKVGGGFKLWQRIAIWDKPELYIDKAVEIHYQEDTPNGDFRQARFKKFRPDKD